MKRTIFLTGTLIIAVLSLLTWRFEHFAGDGVYHKKGLILTTNTLTLPEIPLDHDGEYRFSFRNLDANNGPYSPYFFVSSSEPIPFWNVSTEVIIDVQDSLGSIFAFGGPLNAHYVRMWEAHEVMWPDENEWFAPYQYNDPNIDRKAVPFAPQKRPNLSKSLRYLSLPKEVPFKDHRTYAAIIRVSHADKKLMGLKGQLSFVSHWK